MTFSLELNYLDAAVILILSLMGCRGVFRGFLAEVAGLVGLVGGVILAGRYHPEVSAYFARSLGKGPWVSVLAYAAVLSGFMLCVGIVSRLLHRILTVACIDSINHMLGFVAGLAKGLAICFVLVYGANLILPSSAMVKQSVTRPYIESTMSFLGTCLPRQGLSGFLPGKMTIPGI